MNWKVYWTSFIYSLQSAHLYSPLSIKRWSPWNRSVHFVSKVSNLYSSNTDVRVTPGCFPAVAQHTSLSLHLRPSSFESLNPHCHFSVWFHFFVSHWLCASVFSFPNFTFMRFVFDMQFSPLFLSLSFMTSVRLVAFALFLLRWDVFLPLFFFFLPHRDDVTFSPSLLYHHFMCK